MAGTGWPRSPEEPGHIPRMTETSQEDRSWQSYTNHGLGRSGSLLSKSSSVSSITGHSTIYKMSLCGNVLFLPSASTFTIKLVTKNNF